MHRENRVRTPLTLLPGLLLAVLFAALLSGCSGWQLRGNTHTPLFEDLSLHNASARLQYTMEDQLDKVGVPLRAQARYIVNIVDEHWSRRTAAVDQRGRAAERELTYEVVWQLVDRNTGAILNPPRHIMAMRSFAYSPDNVTATSDEENLVETDLYEDVVYRLVNQLADASRKIQAGDR